MVLSYNHTPRSRLIYNGLNVGAGGAPLTRRLGGLEILSEALRVHVKHAHVSCQVYSVTHTVGRPFYREHTVFYVFSGDLSTENRVLL